MNGTSALIMMIAIVLWVLFPPWRTDDFFKDLTVLTFELSRRLNRDTDTDTDGKGTILYARSDDTSPDAP